MNNVWVGTDWHLWSVNSITDKRHQFRSISNLGRLSDAYAEDIQSDDIFIYLGDLCDPSVTDIKKLKAIVSSIPGYKVLCRGNHDTQDDTFYKEIGFDVVCEICVIHNLVFSHKPVRVPIGYLNIHGHLHTEKMSTLGYQHINAYDSNFFERPMLVDDLIDSAAFQSPEEYAGTDLKHVEEKFEKYTSVENDTYTQIVDLTDMVGLYPVDEAVELPTFKTPEELFKWMKSNIHYANFTKLKSSDGVIESKSGSCHDQVVFEYNALKTMGKKPKILFFIAYREGSNQGGMTHSLVYYSEGNKIKWFENSWSGMEGIHTYDSLSDLKADIRKMYSNMPDAKNFPELEFKSASISDFDTGMNLGEFVSGIMDETANDPLDEVLFSDITDVQYWENDDDAPKKKKVKQSPLDTDNQGVVAESVNSQLLNLFFISSEGDLHETEMTPRIPNNYMTENGYEDNKTPRISFSTSIDGCLMGLGKNVSNQVFYVYQPVGKYKVITPTIDQVPDVKITKERWICEPVKLVRVGKIRAIDENGPHDDGIPYTYGKNGEHEARLYHWGWKWIKQFKYDLNESTTMNTFPFIFLSQENMNDELYPEGKMLLRNMDDAVQELYLYQRPAGEYYVHNTEPGYYRIIMSPEFSAGYFSTDTINLSTVGKIKVNSDYSWEWIEQYGSDMNEAATFSQVNLKANPDQYKYEYVLNEMYLNSLSAAVEDTTELHEMSPKDKQAIANKYGLRTPGEYQQDGQDKTQERVNQRREKQLKDLKKARKIKKRKAFVRKVKSHLPGAQNESAMGILSMPKVVSSPPFDIDDKVDLYVGLANKKINEYGKTAKNIPVPKRKFKKNPNKNRAVPDYYLKLWFNPDRASNLLINDAAPNQHTIWLYPDEYCTLMFVCADGVCRVYMLDSYIAGDYHQFLGSFQVDMGIGARLKAALKEDSSGVDDSESDHYEADATDRDPLWGDRNHFFKHPNAADPDIDTSIQESSVKSSILYHGSQNKYSVLKPKSKNDGRNVLFASPRYEFSLAYAGKQWNDLDINQSVVNNKLVLVEIYPGAFENIFQTSGYIYEVPDDTFQKVSSSEYISEVDVVPIKTRRVQNVLNELEKSSVQLYYYPDLPPYMPSRYEYVKARCDQYGIDFKKIQNDLYRKGATDIIAPIQENYKFELVDKNLRFADRLDEAATKNQKLYPVYVVLVHSGTGVSKAIKAISHSEYSHASICFDSSLDKMYSFARKDPRNPFIGGFRYESIGKGFYEQKEIPYAVYVVPCTESQVKKMKKRLNYFIQNQEKFTFDFTGLVTNYLGIVNNPAHRWFCSRFVADVLNAGAPKNNPYVAEPSLQDPDDFKDTDWAIYVDSGENLMKYDRKKVDRKTNQIIRKEMLRRMAVNESAIFDLDAFNPFIESTLNYQFAMMDEAAVDDFVRYLKSFKVKFDKEGNVIISRREVDQLDKHFRQSLRMIKAYENAGDLDSVKLELCKINYMIELINEYYLSPKAMKSKRVKADLRKEMLDLRSVMLNAFSQHLKYVKTMDPTFNFKSYYDTSIYGKNIEIPKPVLSAIGKAIVTQL